MTFGQVLRDIKKIYNLKNKDLAEICRTTEGSLANYFNDKNTPSFNVVKNLASVFTEYPWENLLFDIVPGDRANISNTSSKPLTDSEREIIALRKTIELKDQLVKEKEQHILSLKETIRILKK